MGWSPRRGEPIADQTRTECGPNALAGSLDAPHDGANRRLFVVPIDAGNPQTDCRRRHRAIADRGLHQLVQNLLDGELPRRMQVRPRAARLRQHRAAFVREQTHGFGAAGIDAEHVHRSGSYVTLRRFPRSRSPDFL